MIRDGKPGRSFARGEAGYERALFGTSFNGRDPGRRPERIVQANTAADVIQAVKAAQAQGLKITVCSGGHNWAQNHIRDGVMMLDLSRLNTIQIDRAAMTARIGPGCEGAELNRRLARRGLFFPTPHAPDVGMGGFLLQGGFGWGSRAFGMACENVLGVDVVLADGSLVQADAQTHPDLYWAARGSGLGFFGVVVAFHLKLHKRPRAIGIASQVFGLEHLDEVYRWLDAIGPSVSRQVELQVLMTPRPMFLNRPGLEVIAPVLADSWRAAREAVAFLKTSPLRSKAVVTTPLLPLSLDVMQKGAARTHFPDGMRWCVDNMWTDAPIDDLLPGLRAIAADMPPEPSHVLWLDWRAAGERPDMAFSMEAQRYLALYGEWRNPADDGRYLDWATRHMRAMAPLGVGSQLADENLARRPAKVLADANLKRLEALRERYDPQGLIGGWPGGEA